MQLVQFGRRVQLFGSLNTPRTFSTPHTAVVLCNPFGEEALRAHRIYRIFSRNLAQNGVPSLRFDYSASGDSYGESAEASLDTWVDDACEAAEELRRRSRATEYVLFGLRLGGTIAALAASRSAIGRVIQWDPVIDGRAYLQELAASHARYLESELQKPLGSVPPEMPPREALGHPIGQALAAQLCQLRLGTTQQASHPYNQAVFAERLKLTVLWTGALTEEAAVYKTAVEGTQGGRWVNINSTTPWNSDAALNRAVVPMDVIDVAVESIARSPAPA